MKNFIKTFTNAEEVIHDYDAFFESLIAEDTLQLELELTSSECKGSPKLTVKFNDNTVYSNHLPTGRHTIQKDFDVKNLKESIIEISMSDKKIDDTEVENGKIINDKFIIIDSLKINNYNIMNDPELFYSKFEYRNDNTQQTENIRSGFWNNSTLLLKFSLPFVKWYQENSLRNITLSDPMKYLDNKKLVDQEYEKLIEKLKLLR
jgi:hypothetical protein